MNTNRADGGEAFANDFNDGMSLRDYFAAHAPDDCAVFLPHGWKFSEPRPVRPANYRSGDEDVDAAHDAACGLHDSRSSAARRIAARWAYADAMIAAGQGKVPA